MIINLNSNSSEYTKEIGKRIGSVLKGNELILLSGDLGMGKTLFTKGLASGLGLAESEIVSPTFTLQNCYYIEKLEKNLYHFDLYRIGTGKGTGSNSKSGGLISPEIDENIKDHIVVVEWAQYLDPSYFNESDIIHVEFTIETDNLHHRQLKIETEEPQLISILKGL